jgi:hypothetical protein
VIDETILEVLREVQFDDLHLGAQVFHFLQRIALPVKGEAGER